MNACEPLQIAQMNLRPGRGRSIEHLTALALQQLRFVRKQTEGLWFSIVSEDGHRRDVCGTFRAALLARCKMRLELGVQCEVLDGQTQIQLT